MKNKELIEKLKTFPEEMEVCIYDYLRSEKEYDGEPNGAGIYKDFEIDIMNNEDDDIDDDGNPLTKWVALGFKNDFIDEE